LAEEIGDGLSLGFVVFHDEQLFDVRLQKLPEPIEGRIYAFSGGRF
jgi:hypothetical protein